MYRRIVVGTDGSKTAAQAVDRAVEVAGAYGAELTILTVSDDDDKGNAVVAAEAGRHAGSGVTIHTAVLPGDPAAVLVDEAHRFDLLVVGNRGMTGASRFFLGSVPNKVSHHAPGALLIVRTT